MEAANQSQFNPGVIGGFPIKSWVRYPVEFKFQSGEEEEPLTSVDIGTVTGSVFFEDTSIVIPVTPDTLLPPEKQEPGHFAPFDITPGVVSAHKPEFPPEASPDSITGTVWLAVKIDEDGNVLDVKVHSSTVTEVLDSAAIKSAYQSEFQPGVVNGRPAKCWDMYPVEFKPGKMIISTAPEDTASISSEMLPDDMTGAVVTTSDTGDVILETDTIADTLAVTRPPDTLADDTIPAEDPEICVIPPEPIDLHQPNYPPPAKQAGITGTTMVSVNVDTTGQVINASVEQTSGTVTLDAAALRAAYQGRFRPGLNSNNRPVECWLSYPVEFSLDDDTSLADDTLGRDSGAVIDDTIRVNTTVQILDDTIPADSSSYDSLEVPVDDTIADSSITDSSQVPVDTVLPDTNIVHDTAKIGGDAMTSDTVFGDTARTSTDSVTTDSLSQDSTRNLEDTAQTYAGPEIIDFHQPLYPDSAREAGITGTAWVKVLINESGSIVDVVVDTSSGSTSLDSAAVEAIYKSRFKPAELNGKPVTDTLTFPVEFKLGDK